MKICTKCKLEKPFNEFYRDKKLKGGYCVWCKKCSSIYHKKYRKKNTDKLSKYYKKWRENNIENLKEYIKKYYKKNKDLKTSYDVIWKNSYATYSSSLAKNIAWHDYTEEDKNGLLIVKCTYCGKKFTPKYKELHSRNRAINETGTDTSSLYCSSGCKKACPTYQQHKYYKGQKIDGSSREVQPELRQMCLERDNYTCQKCGAKGKTIQLHCHHIKSLADDPIESADVDNTITLCKSCHKEVHTKEGCKYHQLRC